jgi:hypothetical protein
MHRAYKNWWSSNWPWMSPTPSPPGAGAAALLPAQHPSPVSLQETSLTAVHIATTIVTSPRNLVAVLANCCNIRPDAMGTLKLLFCPGTSFCYLLKLGNRALNKINTRSIDTSDLWKVLSRATIRHKTNCNTGTYLLPKYRYRIIQHQWCALGLTSAQHNFHYALTTF